MPKLKDATKRGSGAGPQMATGKEQSAPESSKPEPEQREELGYKVNGREGPDEAKRSAGNVSIKLTEDGAADPGTRENTWKKLSEMIAKTPGARVKIFGGAAEAPKLIESEKVQPLYTALGLLNTAIAVYLLKMPKEACQAIIPYTADELRLLGDVTAEAANENLDKIPPWLMQLLQGGGSLALGKLAMVFFQVHTNKLQTIKGAMAQPGERTAAVN